MGLDAAQGNPRLAEVVAIEDTVASRTCSHGGIEAIVLALAHDAALHDASTAEEQTVDLTGGVGVEEAVDLLRDVLGLAPRLPVVVAVEAAYVVAVVARTAGVDDAATHADEQHARTLAVGHEGRIAEAARHGAAYARSVSYLFGCRPRQSVVRRAPHHEVHLAVANVVVARTVVVDGHEGAVRGRGDGGYAVGMALWAVAVEEVLILVIGVGMEGDCHFAVLVRFHTGQLIAAVGYVFAYLQLLVGGQVVDVGLSVVGGGQRLVGCCASIFDLQVCHPCVVGGVGVGACVAIGDARLADTLEVPVRACTAGLPELDGETRGTSVAVDTLFGCSADQRNDVARTLFGLGIGVDEHPVASLFGGGEVDGCAVLRAVGCQCYVAARSAIEDEEVVRCAHETPEIVLAGDVQRGVCGRVAAVAPCCACSGFGGAESYPLFAVGLTKDVGLLLGPAEVGRGDDAEQ